MTSILCNIDNKKRMRSPQLYVIARNEKKKGERRKTREKGREEKAT